MTVNHAFRYELEPTQRQQRLLAKAAGTARYADNGGLARCKRLLDAGKRVPHAAELHRLWNKCCGQEALRDLDGDHARRGRGAGSASRASAASTGEGIPSGSLAASRSTGTKVEAPKPRAKSLRRLRRRQRLHHRTRHGSRNRQKSALGLARRHRRIRCQRTEFLHKLTTALAKTKSVIVVEDLSVQGMLGNQYLSRSIADAGWGEFRRMLEYKTQWYGSRLITAPRFYPSTKTCSACGYAKDGMPLSERVLRCEACGADRDLNTARNLASLVAGEFPGDANRLWRGMLSGRENGPVKPAPVKQEPASRTPSAATGGNKR
jgi:IS605 OrfB family transposase